MDNPRFYRELKTFIVNGEGWSYIKKFERCQDGRKAYLALKPQCEGTSSKITRKNKAYASIAKATYSGSRRQYKFQDVINVHQTAHNEILDCKAHRNRRKVADFLKGITDQKLEFAVSVVLGDQTMLTTFSDACNTCRQPSRTGQPWRGARSETSRASEVVTRLRRRRSQ
jgi:hypothetical protein